VCLGSVKMVHANADGASRWCIKMVHQDGACQWCLPTQPCLPWLVSELMCLSVAVCVSVVPKCFRSPFSVFVSVYVCVSVHLCLLSLSLCLPPFSVFACVSVLLCLCLLVCVCESVYVSMCECVCVCLGGVKEVHANLVLCQGLWCCQLGLCCHGLSQCVCL